MVNHNSGPWLSRCLQALAEQILSDFETVVVDNASTDESAAALLPDPRFRRLRPDRNLGFAAGNNLAARDCAAPWLALLNPDAVPHPDWLASLLQEAERHPDCVIFGSTQWRAGAAEVLDGSGDCLSLYGMTWRSGYGQRVRTPLHGDEVLAACGAALMIRRDWFERLGGLEERLFCYVEDVDLCLRARLQGASVWQSAIAQVQHVGGASTEFGSSCFSLYHGNRNLIWVIARCIPLPWLLISLPGAVLWTLLRAAIKRGSLQQRRALLRAVRDGLASLPEVWEERQHIQRQRRVGVGTVLGWLSLNPFDALLRRRLVVDTKKNARPEAGRS